MEVEHIQPRYPIVINVASYALYFLVATRAECFVAGTCENDHAYVTCLTAISHGVKHLKICVRTERIIHLRPVYRYFCNLAVSFKEYVIVLLYLCPFSFHNELGDMSIFVCKISEKSFTFACILDGKIVPLHPNSNTNH